MRTPEELFESADKHLLQAQVIAGTPAGANRAAVAQAEILLAVSIRAIEEDEDDSADTERQ